MDIIKQCAKQKYTFEWNDQGQTQKVSVRIPDIRVVNHRVAGDWGPMYVFELDNTDLVEITYAQESYKLNMKQLKIESPRLYDERQKFPYYIVIKDERKKRQYNLFLDRENQVKKVAVFSLKELAILIKEEEVVPVLDIAV